MFTKNSRKIFGYANKHLFLRQRRIEKDGRMWYNKQKILRRNVLCQDPEAVDTAAADAADLAVAATEVSVAAATAAFMAARIMARITDPTRAFFGGMAPGITAVDA